MYHPVIKQKWNGEMTLLVADVALGECKDLGYGSQSCPNDDFDAWCEEGANRAQCGKAVAEDKRLTPSRPPILQVTYMHCDTCTVTYRDSDPACPASAHPHTHCDTHTVTHALCSRPATRPANGISRTCTALFPEKI